jgi:hypothetical protein
MLPERRIYTKSPTLRTPERTAISRLRNEPAAHFPQYKFTRSPVHLLAFWSVIAVRAAPVVLAG